MKLNRVTIFCLVIAGLLAGGVLIASAAGYVTYEDFNKIILWDNVRLTNKGLNMSNVTGTIAGGYINIGSGKDLYIKKFMAFDCSPNYPTERGCGMTFGDIGGNTFLKIGQIQSLGQPLTLESTYSGISLVGTSVNINAHLYLENNKNLIITDKVVPSAVNSVFVDNLKVNKIQATIPTDKKLTIVPPLKLQQGAILVTFVYIHYDNFPKEWLH